jgi:hypothetical protein
LTRAGAGAAACCMRHAVACLLALLPAAAQTAHTQPVKPAAACRAAEGLTGTAYQKHTLSLSILATQRGPFEASLAHALPLFFFVELFLAPLHGFRADFFIPPAYLLYLLIADSVFWRANLDHASVDDFSYAGVPLLQLHQPPQRPPSVTLRRSTAAATAAAAATTAAAAPTTTTTTAATAATAA